jgi:hypothetical protein
MTSRNTETRTNTSQSIKITFIINNSTCFITKTVFEHLFMNTAFYI